MPGLSQLPDASSQVIVASFQVIADSPAPDSLVIAKLFLDSLDREIDAILSE